MRKPEFSPLDLRTWKRGQMFYYFAKMAPTGYSLTVDVDITRMLAVCGEAGVKFFPAYLWLVTKCLNRQEEFRIAEKEGQIGYYDFLTPLYASFQEDDQTFSLMWTEFQEDFSVFYRAYLENQKRYGDNHGVLCQNRTVPPENAYTVSCVPWISFRSFSVHSYGNKPYYFPSVEAGRYYESGGSILMPLSITCHHAASDGYHVKCFLEDFQESADNFAWFLPKESERNG